MIRKQIQTIDPEQAVSRVQMLETIVTESVAYERFVVFLIGVFGVMALTLSALGVYAVYSYTVTERTKEIGIRVALGAQRGSVLKLIMWDSLKLVLVGIILGWVIAFEATRLVESLLYGINKIDVLTMTLVSLLLLVITSLACYFPARKAMNLDPLLALRQE